MSNKFPLAPMSPLIKGLTIILLLLPLFLTIYALIYPQKSIIFVLLFLIILYVIVWIWCRPSCFVVSSHYLKIMFPGWCRRIPITDILSVRLLDQQTFNQDFGWAMRIGVGGLWGGFGWLWTSRKAFLEFYISRTDNFVFIERSTGNSLLITPINPQEMMKTIQELLQSPLLSDEPLDKKDEE